MRISTVLFDLDGTLLPMDQDEFIKGYFKLLVAKLAPYGYEPKQLIDAIWSGTADMIKNDGVQRNETVFWAKFSEIFGERVFANKPLFDAFYTGEFQNAKSCCGYNPEAAEAVLRIKERGCRVVLATNPIFPAIATESRIRWAGLAPSDFEWYTTYENSRYCKPNPAYYQDILQKLQCEPEECLMVGNDVTEDMVAQDLGMQVFLLTDCLINKDQKDISVYPHGSFRQLLDFLAANHAQNPLC